MFRMEVVLAFLLMFFSSYLFAQQEGENPLAVALTVKDDIVEAINKKNIDKVTSFLSDDVYIVLENAQVFHSKSDFKDFLSSTPILEKYKVKKYTIENVAVDKEFQMTNSKSFLATGTADFDYALVRGRVLRVPVRWMANFEQDEEGKWLLSSYQATVNVLDNPLIDQMRRDFYMICFIALIMGYIIGIAWVKWIKKAH